MAISSNFRSDLTRAPNKPLPKWNFAPTDAVGTVQAPQGLSGDAFGHDRLGHFCPKSAQNNQKGLEIGFFYFS